MTFGVVELAYPYCHFGEADRMSLQCLVAVWSMLVTCCQAGLGQRRGRLEEWVCGWQAGTLLTWSVLNVTCGAVRFSVLQNKRSYTCIKVHVHWRPSFRAAGIQNNYIYTVWLSYFECKDSPYDCSVNINVVCCTFVTAAVINWSCQWNLRKLRAVICVTHFGNLSCVSCAPSLVWCVDIFCC